MTASRSFVRRANGIHVGCSSANHVQDTEITISKALEITVVKVIRRFLFWLEGFWNKKNICILLRSRKVILLRKEKGNTALRSLKFLG